MLQKLWKGPALAAATAVALVAGSASAESGIDMENKVVTIGAFTPVTGPVPFYAVLTHAAESYFKMINESGEVDGWTFNYITKDDGYDPARSVATARSLVEDDGIFALSAPIGTATNVAVIPYAKEAGVPIIGPVGGSSQFFEVPAVFPLLPDYGWSAGSSTEYAVNGLGHTKIAILWENDELGKSAKRGFDLVMADLGIEPAESIPFDVKTTSFSAHIRRIQNSGAESVLLYGSNANLAAALKAADLQGVDVAWFAPFFTADPSTLKLAGDLLEGVHFSSWLLPVSSDEPEVVAYRESSAKYFPNDPVGVLGLNGWSNAALFHKGFQLLLDSGDEITRENLVKAMNTMTDAAVGGARGVTFSADDHRGTRQEGIIQYKNGEFVLVREFRPYPDVAFNASKGE
ncbi:ABC transporter substrate-binding protein [uncultured Roseovarius sp.]|uniref:ABC transporter substrate-binding protein n=1 Tax=uncultured Roseovarius sp. TaxID=293344 RepID=UPI0025DE41A9|nr:ABC transporter substrate-binding protein [uncultured Roseovarius sp.]